ncbi:hypothetical protein QZH41_017618 [Actinostola sp. cb2023]|nr:hypothetical protein QZH41_017618 [Actinostola sp. cb2023]
MKRRPINPAFKATGQDRQDTNDVSDALLRQARRSGQLNLSNRSLTEVPMKVWKINTELPPEAKNISLDSTDEKWWDQVDLTKLILASNKLTSLSCEVANLPALEFLDIHDNSIETVPTEIGSLENLKRLNLSHNKLPSLPPDVGRLTTLCSLKLQHNSLPSVGEWLGELVHLEDLELSNNKIKDLPANISRLHSLRSLNLSNNLLEALPAEIGHITATTVCVFVVVYQELYLGNNRITKIDSSDLNGFPSLSVLDLRDNRIDNIPDEITILEELERIDLSNNDISSLPFSMGAMPHLKAVVLEGNPLRRIRRDVVMRGTQAILQYLKSRISEEEKQSTRGGDCLDSKVSDRPSVSLAAPSSTVDHHTLNQTKTFNYSNKKVTEIPGEVLQAAVTAKVTTVDLSKNLLANLPRGLSELTGCLSDLNVGFNKLQSLEDSVSCFAKLQFLDLRNNQLSDLPSGLTGLVSLTEITLSYNRFNNLPSVLYSVPSIRIILACGNQIQSIDVNGLLRLPVLDTLDLQNNSISQVPPELGNVTTLRSLQLGGNSFRNPRAAILAKGTPSLLDYLRSRIPT